MRAPKILFALLAAALLTPAATVAADGPVPSGKKGLMGRQHPASVRDPNAMSLAVAGPGYGLFTCQVGRSVGQCYDPYQMRHAYNIDSLINAGFDGTGKTIVIIDAFQ